MRLIDADALKEWVENVTESDWGWQEMLDRIDAEPTIDAVPVVRCKDCKYYREGKLLSPQKFCFRLRGKGGEAIGYNFAEDDFCSYAERIKE